MHVRGRQGRYDRVHSGASCSPGRLRALVALLRPGGILVRATNLGVVSGIGSWKTMQAELPEGAGGTAAAGRHPGAPCSAHLITCNTYSVPYASCHAAHVF